MVPLERFHCVGHARELAFRLKPGREPGRRLLESPVVGVDEQGDQSGQLRALAGLQNPLRSLPDSRGQLRRLQH